MSISSKDRVKAGDNIMISFESLNGYSYFLYFNTDFPFIHIGKTKNRWWKQNKTKEEEEKCEFCRFYDCPYCYRYPKNEYKSHDDYCGEFKQKEMKK